jgi:serine/threonine protein kinase
MPKYVHKCANRNKKRHRMFAHCGGGDESSMVITGTDTYDSLPVAKKVPKQPSKTFEAQAFEKVKQLGEGAYGKVSSYYDKHNKTTVVIKALSKANDPDIDDINNEVYILHLLQDVCQQYILCYTDFYEDTQNYYIVTEFLSHYVVMDEWINRSGLWRNTLLTKDYLKVFNQLQEGLKVIHHSGIAHRDIKTPNIMINPQTLQIKYIDFGVATDGTLLEPNMVGTLSYIAPEMTNDEFDPDEDLPLIKMNLEVWQKADLWSLGMVILEILLGYRVVDYLTLLRLRPIYRKTSQFGQLKFTYEQLGQIISPRQRITTLKSIRENGIDQRLIDMVCVKIDRKYQNSVRMLLDGLLSMDNDSRKFTFIKYP